MQFTEYEIKQMLSVLQKRINQLEGQERNAKRVQVLKNTQKSLYKRLENLKKEGK
jgi:hypothetical protein